MLNVRLRMTLMVAGLGLGWTLMAPPAAAAAPAATQFYDRCFFSLSESLINNVDAAGASGSVAVSWRYVPNPLFPEDGDESVCGDRWSAASQVPWISVSYSNTDNSIFYYTVDPNGASSARTGMIVVATRVVTITQLAGCPSEPQVSSTSLSFTSAGGSQSVTVQEAAHCTYAVSDDQTWIRVRPTNVAGNGTVPVPVDPNTGTSTLSGTVTIGGTTVSVDVPPPPPPPCTFQVEYTSREVAEDPGQYDLSVTASAATCRWSMTRHAGWLDVRTPNRTGSTHGTYRTGDNIGSPERIGTMTVAGHTVTITQRGSDPPEPNPIAPPGPVPEPPAVLILHQHRSRLIQDWGQRNGQSNVCAAWHSLDYSAKYVFIWNTHRLHLSGVLPEVDKLYAIFGRRGTGCGGAAYNRTFMSMDEEGTLHAKFLLAAARGGQVSDEDSWEPTTDPACLLPVGECPHEPFDVQIQTEGDDPRGQIQFFGQPGKLSVIRSYYGFNKDTARYGFCGNEHKVIDPDELCDACDSRIMKFNCRIDSITDEVLTDPAKTYTDGPEGQQVSITDPYSFEMDQDYGPDHKSAPVCQQDKFLPPTGWVTYYYDLRQHYAAEYGDPEWNWNPFVCAAALNAGAAFTFSDESLNSAPIRAVNTMELRGRIDGLRARSGLATYVWTDTTLEYGVTPVRSVHLTELRAALEQVYVAAGQQPPTYTDINIVPGITPIRSIHLTELRAAVVALEVD